MKLNLLSKTVLSVVLLSANLHAQQGEDPYVKGKTPKVAKKPARVIYNIATTLELFSVPIQEAAKLMRDSLSDQVMYDLLVEKGKLEAVAVTCSRSGERVRSSSFKEIIYPTGYEPAKVLKGTGDQPPASVILPAIGTDFVTRYEGLSAEIELTLDYEHELCSFNIIAELTSYIGERENGQGVNMISMPTFETQTIETGATYDVNKPYLLGTMSRPPSSEKGEGLSERVWLVMATVRLVEIRAEATGN